jgi:hypothetical protein
VFTVDRDKLKRAESGGSLIADPWPPGFENGGRRVLAECDEMTLWELYRPGGEQEVVLAPEIERTLWRHLFRINDTFDFGSFERKDRDRRVSLAIALRRLHLLTERLHREGELTGVFPAAQSLVESLGEEIDRALRSRNIKEAARQVGNRVAECVKALAREKGRLRDGRTTKDRIPLLAMLILEAQREFMRHLGKPPKEALIYRMEQRGYRIPGNASIGSWKGLFARAGLDGWYK